MAFMAGPCVLTPDALSRDRRLSIHGGAQWAAKDQLLAGAMAWMVSREPQRTTKAAPKGHICRIFLGEK